MSERYEKELDELLRRLERRIQRETFRQRMLRWLRWTGTVSGGLSGSARRWATVDQIMAASLVLLALSYLGRFIFPRLAFYLAAGCVALFVAAILLSVFRRGTYGREKRWRGRVIELHTDSWWLRMQRWWRGRN